MVTAEQDNAGGKRIADITSCKALRAASLSSSLCRLASAAASAAAAASAFLRASSAALASACNRALSVIEMMSHSCHELKKDFIASHLLFVISQAPPSHAEASQDPFL